MGRRALRKVDPSLDLSYHLRELEQLPRSWEVETVFSRAAGDPAVGGLEVEVGSGKGLFLETASAEHPQRRFLGVEIARKYARFAAARLAQRERDNAVVVHGDALRLFQEHLPDAGVMAVHVYFPDPWWKKRHRKRRIMNPVFLGEIARVLGPGGALHFWTDVEEYFESALDLIREMDLWEGPFPVEEQPAADPMDYRTHFERRMRMHNEAVYRTRFQKR